MRTKIQIRPTTLSTLIIQISVLIASIIFIIVTKEKRFIAELLTAYTFVQYLLFLMFGKEGYNEILSGICKYRIRKEKISDADIYFIQSKPLLLPILPWKGGAYESFLYKKDGDSYLCSNGFKTIEEAINSKTMLEKNGKLEKLFLIKRIEVY